MLDRESQGFDLQKVLFSQETIDIYTQSMRRQFTIQTGTQTPTGMGKIFFNAELPGQLPIDRFDQLADNYEG